MEELPAVRLAQDRAAVEGIDNQALVGIVGVQILEALTRKWPGKLMPSARTPERRATSM